MSKMKRILALALCCTMLLVMLVSCGETEIDESKQFLQTHQPPAEKEYVTLNLYIPCNFEVYKKDNEGKYILGNNGEKVQVDVIESMQNEFNKVIEEKYRTRVIFKFVEEKDYATALSAQMDIALKDKETPFSKTPVSATDKYPKEEEFQLDIFVTTGVSMVEGFVKDGGIADLTQTLGGSYYIKFCNQKDDSSIVTEVYNNAKLNDIRYGVPSNFLIGEYVYKYVHKELANALNFDKNTMTVEDLEKEIEMANATLTPGEAPYVKEDIIKDVLTDEDKAADFDRLIIENPKATIDDIFTGMYCIASTCRNKDRALEVINELFSNSALHTTLQYGSQDLTYKLETVEETVTEIIEGKPVEKTIQKTVVVAKENAPTYSINPRYTGNVCYLYETSTISVYAGALGNIMINAEFIDKVINQNKDLKFTQ